MKNILGLDLGTNSIGWALIQSESEDTTKPTLVRLGSRIIPMNQDVLGKFESGAPTETQAAKRTQYRGMRRLNERRELRRERMFRVLHVLGFLPPHFDAALGWNRAEGRTYGKFIDVAAEPKIAWCKDEQGRMKFLFDEAFEEMVADFAIHQPALVHEGLRIPHDWTLYYLRQKALTQRVSPYELAWILMSFNQKRGYYQLRGKDELGGQEEEDKTKREEYYCLLVESVEPDPDDKPRGDRRWYNIHLEGGRIYRRQSDTPLDDWIGKKREFIITSEFEADGVTPKLDKEGRPKCSYRSPGEDDWGLIKKRTEVSLSASGLTVGAYIYQKLLSTPDEKIIGQTVKTIDRHFYSDELRAILECQKQFHPQLTDQVLLDACAHELYSRNEAHRSGLLRHDLSYLLINDVLFYQRPLKSKKSLIADCPYEHYHYADHTTGELFSRPIKVAAKSNPWFQELRIRLWMKNLRFYQTGNLDDIEVTTQYLPDASTYEHLYEWLATHAEVKQDTLLKDFLGLKKPKGKDSSYPIRWNYVEDKAYPMGETRAHLIKCLTQAEADASTLADPSRQYALWHLLYSIDDVAELRQALLRHATEYGAADADRFADVLSRSKPFDKDYAAYSEKAIKKLLPCIRQGMALHEACNEVYGTYSEGRRADRWTSPSQLRSFIAAFQQSSLRNPIVEQCLLETLRTVADIWEEAGHIDEIHLEMGREMKNPRDKRAAIGEQNRRNEATNLRIKAMLQDLFDSGAAAEVRPNSPMQQDILRIYEEGALMELQPSDPDYKEILAISKMAQPTSSQLMRYRLWLEQRYRSPYTGRIIPLSRLFTTDYQIEHIIPRARYYDDSLSNKVICESEVNLLKSNMLAHEFISTNGGRKVSTTSGTVTVFTLEEYERFIAEHYAQLRNKQRRLLFDDIPEEFIQRQLNDSRYIAREIKSLLSNIVREEGEAEDTSKHLIVCTGGVTDRLKKDWGLNDVWNHLVAPRYERLNQLTGTQLFGHWEMKASEGGQGKRVFQTAMPLSLQQGYSKKRIDHRHHAMDALVIACASRSIVNLLSNINAHDRIAREDLRHKLMAKGGLIHKPWPTFTQDAEDALRQVIVSFRNKVRVLTRATNAYDILDADGNRKRVTQSGDVQWSVRKPLHKETFYGHVNLRRIKQVSLDTALADVNNIADTKLRLHIVELFSQGLDKRQIKKALKAEGISSKIDVYYMTDTDTPMVAVRKTLDTSFDAKHIAAISDTGIQKILLAYLEVKGGDPKVAFTPEGIEDLNQNIALYNDNRPHKPILKVRVTEPMGEKFAVGYSGHKSSKFVIAQSGTNLFFAIYADEEGNRSYSTIPLQDVVSRLKQNEAPAPLHNEEGSRLLFTLSPNELVYVPSEDEQLSGSLPAIAELDPERIYKFVDGSGTTANFVPHRIANLLYSQSKEQAANYCKNDIIQNELGLGSPQSKNQRSIGGQMIKTVCWKLEINRLGQITKIIR